MRNLTNGYFTGYIRWIIIIMCFLVLAGCVDNGTTEPGTPSPISMSATEAIGAEPSPIVELIQESEPGFVADGAKLREHWLNDESCAPPCWEGVTPGITSADDAYELIILNDLFTNAVRMNSRLPGDTTGSIACEFSYMDDYGEVQHCSPEMFFDYTTEEQTIRVIRTCIPLTYLNEYIEEWGEPSHVNTNFDYYHSPSSWAVYIIWMEKGIEISAHGVVPVNWIDDTLGMYLINYFQPGLEGYLEAVGSNQLEGLREWQGYADFEFYHRYSCCTPVSPSP